MKYEFTDDYLTGIASVDKQHSKLFDLANACYDLVMESTADEKYDHIVAILDELASSMRVRILRTRRRIWSTSAIRTDSATVRCTCAL